MSGPAGWFDGASRVLFVHAHPDDETIATGGTLAALAAAGREPLLVTLSRGERGEAVPGSFAGSAGPAGLAAHREGELAAALAALGVSSHAFLGSAPARAAGLPARVYEDSGMAWGPDGFAAAASDGSVGALTRAPAAEALNDLIAAAVAWDAEAVVSYDERGGYGHPDHVFAHRAARAVAHGLELPYWEIVADRAGDPPPREELELHDAAPWLDRKLVALRAHGTQLTVEDEDEGPVIVHVGGQREPVGHLEVFRRMG
ncbi:PIG-L family deacetylase [Leucobacter weissii]|uniref:PIG-L family deacetylase n=1 Tax=Leucobacter weissii TaxID=1983706 RepID=A0A939S9T8_9MICO|nr:PIG-L family deacetylase [Leucobacter weissii]MBO1901257.1 PIG-L family deacetylase [Leucobacter weissii]